MYNFRFVYSDSTTTTTTCDDKESAWLEGTKTSVMASMNGSRNTSSVLNDVGIIFFHTQILSLYPFMVKDSLNLPPHICILHQTEKKALFFLLLMCMLAVLAVKILFLCFPL